MAAPVAPCQGRGVIPSGGFDAFRPADSTRKSTQNTAPRAVRAAAAAAGRRITRQPLTACPICSRMWVFGRAHECCAAAPAAYGFACIGEVGRWPGWTRRSAAIAARRGAGFFARPDGLPARLDVGPGGQTGRRSVWQCPAGSPRPARTVLGGTTSRHRRPGESSGPEARSRFTLAA